MVIHDEILHDLTNLETQHCLGVSLETSGMDGAGPICIYTGRAFA